MQISNYSHVHSSYITEHPREKLKIKIIALNECRDAEISTYQKKKTLEKSLKFKQFLSI